MSSNRASSTSSSSATERLRSAAFAAGAALVACAALLTLGAEPASAFAKKGPLVTLVSEVRGERTLEVFDLRFASFQTIYKHKAAPRSESPTGERIEVIHKRKECSCLRLADYRKISMRQVRQIDVTYPEGGRVALVRITWRDGKVREYPATGLYGGDGLFPPRFTATVEGQPREFPLILPDTQDATWPEERLVRAILYRPTSPPPPKKTTSTKKGGKSASP
jgi:hypothetical protein